MRERDHGGLVPTPNNALTVIHLSRSLKAGGVDSPIISLLNALGVQQQKCATLLLYIARPHQTNGAYRRHSLAGAESAHFIIQMTWSIYISIYMYIFIRMYKDE